MVARECDRNSISISFIPANFQPTNQNLDQLDPSFMYRQLLKEILLTIDFERTPFHEFLIFCREQFVDNDGELRNVDKIENEYHHHHQPIWCNTFESFLYSMVNRALRLLEGDIIIKMGFFVRDLHNHIALLHAEQFGEHHYSNSFMVYRGQGSTNNPDMMGVVFVIEIDPTITTTSFADVRDVGYFPSEDEILFSMHAVFRIGQIQELDKNDRLRHVVLTLTSDIDPQLRTLTECIRREISPHQRGWYRLSSFLLKMGQFQKAEELFQVILAQIHDESEKANIYHMLGISKYDNREHAESIKFYEISVEIMQKILPAYHPDLSASYRNIAAVCGRMSEHSKALAYHEKALETYQDTSYPDHQAFSPSSDDRDPKDERAGDCTKATVSLKRIIKILKQIHFEDDLSLVVFYDLYGSACEKMGNNEQAREFYQSAIKIKERHLCPNHPSLLASRSNYATVLDKLGDSSEARPIHQSVLNDAQQSLPANHPDQETYRQRAQN